MCLFEAVSDVIDILGRETWERIVAIITKDDSLPDREVKVIEKAIAKAYGRWSDAQRRSIWYETDTGMTDYDDALCDTSFNGIGYSLQIGMLDEVTKAAWRDARESKKASVERRHTRNAAK